MSFKKFYLSLVCLFFILVFILWGLLKLIGPQVIVPKTEVTQYVSNELETKDKVVLEVLSAVNKENKNKNLSYIELVVVVNDKHELLKINIGDNGFREQEDALFYVPKDKIFTSVKEGVKYLDFDFTQYIVITKDGNSKDMSIFDVSVQKYKCDLYLDYIVLDDSY